MNTNNKNKNSVSFLAQISQGIREIVTKAETREEVISSLEQYLGMKIRESFKNGIEVGKKNASRERSGQGRRQRPPYSRQ